MHMEKTALIYYVEDDDNIRQLATYTLCMSGFEARGFSCAREFFEACEDQVPDLILLDIMLPYVSGLDILRQVRQDRALADLPVMMLTAKDTEYDVVMGLDSGADDYLAKPFGMMELVSRVKALLRITKRTRLGQRASEKDALVVGALALDGAKHVVTLDGNPVQLTVKEFDLLRTLMENEGRVLTRAQLLENVWHMPSAGETRTVDVHIMSLRQKLSAIREGADESIRTVRGVGYVLRQ